MNSQIALERLLAGNVRFVNGEAEGAGLSEAERSALVQGQQPFATILACVDSRVPPTVIFDAKPGDLLVARTAGHVVDDAVMGSIEFGVLKLGTPLILILGHSHCGAVSAAAAVSDEDEPLPGQLDTLVSALKPAVQAARVLGGDIVDKAIQVNVRFTIDRLMSSPVIEEAVNAGKTTIVGAVYSLETGEVSLVDSDVN